VDSAPVAIPPFLQNSTGGNPAIFHFPTSTSLGFQFGKSARALNPAPPFQYGEPQITTAIIDTKKFGAVKDYCRLHSPDDDRESDSGLDISFVTGKHWSATMSPHGSDEAELCKHQRISVNMLSHAGMYPVLNS